MVKIHYVEIKQAEANRPKGVVEQLIEVSPGKAVLLSLTGGRSSPDGLIFVAPQIVSK
jgi:hypothetical protein